MILYIILTASDFSRQYTCTTPEDRLFSQQRIAYISADKIDPGADPIPPIHIGPDRISCDTGNFRIQEQVALS